MNRMSDFDDSGHLNEKSRHAATLHVVSDTNRTEEHLDTGTVTTEEPYESLAQVLGEKLNLETTEGDLNNFDSKSGEKLHYGYNASSQEKTNGKNPDEDLENDVSNCPCSDCWFAEKNKNYLKLKPNQYLDYFPDRYVIGGTGHKLYTQLLRPKKRKKPKAFGKKCDERFGEKRDDMEDAYFWDHVGVERKSRIFADAALSYMRKKGHNLELVKPGLYEFGEIELGFRIHFNFKAKRDDDPDAPVETYFGQLRYYEEPDMVVECCVSIGESDTLPYERDNRGCEYCTKLVHHPLGGCKGIIWGLFTLSHRSQNYIIT